MEKTKLKSTHYCLQADAHTKQSAALDLNRAFHGWGHRFLWNGEMLEEALRACGFGSLTFCRYGESLQPLFRGIERHETYGDSHDLPHGVVVEAQPGSADPVRLAALRDRVRRQFPDHLG